MPEPYCPRCGKKYRVTDCKFIESPSLEHAEFDEIWLWEEGGVELLPIREWTCTRCKLSHATLEISLEQLHRLTHDSASKVAFIAAAKARHELEVARETLHIRRPLGELYVASSELAKIVGSEPQLRTDMVKKFWAYIHDQKLQDPTNMRVIRADRCLKSIVGRATLEMFEIPDIFSKHLVKAR